MINLRSASVLGLIFSTLVWVSGCGSNDRRDVLAVLNEGDSMIASTSAEIETLCDRLRDLLTKSSAAISTESATEFRTLLARLRELQEQRESLRMIGTSTELATLAAKCRRFKNAIQQSSDPSARASLAIEEKAAADSLEKAIEQAAATDANHKAAVEADAAGAGAFSKAMSIHFFLANAIRDSEQALDRGVKGAIDANIKFRGMYDTFRNHLTSLGKAAAKIDIDDRATAVGEAVRPIEELASKKEETEKECRRLRLSS